MKGNEIYKKIQIWRLRHMSERTFVWILSVLVGLCAGLAAVVLKRSVHFVNHILLQYGIPTFVGGNLLILIYPAIGILLTILFVKLVIKGPIGHGLPAVLLAISRKKNYLHPRNMYSSLVASIITVAFGGSVGLEAPIASTGSAIGSNIGRFFRLSQQNVKMLIGCGAAGAIAGIFNAPIAGVLFVVEVFLFDLSHTSAISLLLSSVSASALAYFFMGTDARFAFTVMEGFEISQIPFYIILGIFCAFASIYFLRVTESIEGWFARFKSPWTRLCIGGLMLGIMIFLFPPLFGEGYSSLTSLLHSDSSTLFEHSIFSSLSSNTWCVLGMILLLVLLKAVATATTIGCGGVGGTFGPSLILGGLSGYFVAMLLNQLGLPQQSEANFALVGMAAVMTGVMHAPFMAVLLIAEITGGYDLMAPLLLTSAVSYVVVSPFENHSIYAKKLAEQGNLLTHDKDQSAWQLINMRKLIETNFGTVRQGGKLRDLVEAIQNSSRNIFPVLDEQDRFLGYINLDDVRKIIFCPELYDTTTIEELMQRCQEGDTVCLSDSPQDVVEKFRNSDRYNLVVLDDDGSYVGFLSRANLFSAYRRFVRDVSEE